MGAARIIRGLRTAARPTGGTVKVVGLGTMGVTKAVMETGLMTTQTAQSVFNKTLPSLAIGKGFADLVSGVTSILDDCADDLDKYGYSPTAKKLRGSLQAASGAFLLEGSVEYFLGDAVGLAAFGINLPMKLAISYFADFMLACDNLRTGLWLGLPVAADEETATNRRAAILKLVHSGLEMAASLTASAGFMVLALTSPFNPIALVLLTVSAAITLINNYKEIKGRVAGFFNQTSNVKDVMAIDAPRTESSRNTHV